MPIYNPFKGIRDNAKSWDSFLKQSIRKLRLLMRTVGFACAVVILGLLSNSLAIYHTSIKSLNLIGPENLSYSYFTWPPNVKTWPSVLNLSIAVISVIWTLIILIMYFVKRNWSNRFATMYTAFNLTISILFFWFWGVGAVILQSMHDAKNNDLWSVSCGKKDLADQNSDISNMIINFDFVCIAQKWATICGFLSVALEFMNIILIILMYMRLRSKKKYLKEHGTHYRVVDNGYDLVLISDEQNGNVEGQKETLSVDNSNPEKKLEKKLKTSLEDSN